MSGAEVIPLHPGVEIGDWPGSRWHPSMQLSPAVQQRWLMACVTVFGPVVTNVEITDRAMFLKELRRVGATPDDLLARAEGYATEWPMAELTQLAMLRHWSRFDPARQAQRPVAAPKMNPGTEVALRVLQRRQGA